MVTAKKMNDEKMKRRDISRFKLLKMDRHPEEKKRNQEILVQPTVEKQPEEPLQIPPPEEPLQIPPPDEPLKVPSQEQQQEPIQGPIQEPIQELRRSRRKKTSTFEKNLKDYIS